MLIDGLGWDLLSTHQAAAPFLSELAMTSAPLTAGFPATTATSLATLGTGRPPGQHGLLGYQVAIPGSDRLLNALRWDASVDPLRWQPGSTIFERAESAGVAAFRIAPGAFRKSGLSVAAMRGADYRAADTLGALVSRTVAALGEASPALASVVLRRPGLDRARARLRFRCVGVPARARRQAGRAAGRSAAARHGAACDGGSRDDRCPGRRPDRRRRGAAAARRRGPARRRAAGQACVLHARGG